MFTKMPFGMISSCDDMMRVLSLWLLDVKKKTWREHVIFCSIERILFVLKIMLRTLYIVYSNHHHFMEAKTTLQMGKLNARVLTLSVDRLKTISSHSKEPFHFVRVPKNIERFGKAFSAFISLFDKFNNIQKLLSSCDETLFNLKWKTADLCELKVNAWFPWTFHDFRFQFCHF